MVDIDIHHIRGGIKREIPHILQNHRSRNSAAAIAYQVFEQRKFGAGQLDLPHAAWDRVADTVQLKIGELTVSTL